MSMERVVVLNVGGTSFQTYVSTLSSKSDYFRRMFEGEWSEASAAQPIFVDRGNQFAPFQALSD
jgi:hypothetical protein